MRRDEIPTPSLVLDLAALRQNVAVMSQFAKARAIGLRPHAKSHKCVEIARMLSDAGALGACCATIGEAEALAAGGLRGLLITSPMSTPHMLDRLRKLLLRRADVTVVADNAANVQELASLSRALGCVLRMVVELDVGVGRTGCHEVTDAVTLAKAIAAEASLSFAGVQAYWGNLQQVMPFDERGRLVVQQAEKLRRLIGALVESALRPSIVTGGGTGTHWLDAELDLFTELQSGSFVFLDSLYGPLPLTPNGNPFAPSLFVAASVISTNQNGSVIVNAGLKALATDSGKAVPMRGAEQGAAYRFLGDEHGAIDIQHTAPRLGSIIELLTPHCDPTVNLHNRYIVVENNEVVDDWPILARGY